MIQAVIFDHDGVLVDTEPIQWRVWSQVLGEHGVKLDEQEYSQNARGSSTKEVINYFLAGKYPPEKLAEIADQKSRLTFEQGKNAQAVTGVRAFVQSAFDAGYKIGVASSGDTHKVLYTTEILGINDYLTAVVTAGDISRPKPDPEIFLRTAQLLDIRPQNCLVFEDAISGLHAARKAGMWTVLVKTSHSEADIDPELYDMAIADFTQITVKDITTLSSKK